MLIASVSDFRKDIKSYLDKVIRPLKFGCIIILEMKNHKIQ